jgi:hypothetical protein
MEFRIFNFSLGNARKQSTWLWRTIRSVESSWTSLTSGPLISLLKSVDNSGQCWCHKEKFEFLVTASVLTVFCF